MSELTPELIVDLQIPQDIQISPDGKRIAYTLGALCKRDEHAESAIWLATTDGAEAPRQFTAGGVQDKSPQWEPDGNALAFLSDRVERGTAQLYLISANGGEAQALTPRENKRGVVLFAWSPGGGQIAFTSVDEPDEEDERREKERDDAQVYGEKWPYARLRLLSLASREVSTLVAGERHVANFAWHPQGRELAYTTWKTPELNSSVQETVIERISLAGGEPQVVCHFAYGASNLTWSADGETLLFTSATAQRDQSSTAVYAVPASGGEPKRLAGGETNCIFELQQLREDVLVIVAEGLETKLCRLQPQSGELISLLPDSKAVRESDISSAHACVLADGRTVVALTRSSAQEAFEIWSGVAEVGKAAQKLRQVTHHQEHFTGFVLGEQEAFYWTAPDGWKMDGILIRPPEATTDQPLPTIVLVHGGPYGRWDHGLHLSWGNWAQWLATAGYAILMPNPRGGLGHGEEFAAAARGDVGGADFQDVMSALDAAIERGIADPERLGIGGWSQGGFMSAWAVTQTSRFKAAIMGAGVSDWGMMVVTSDLPAFEQALGETSPWDGVGPHRHAQLSPISFTQQVQTPVLILHGERDARVPLSQAIGFQRALRHYQTPVEMVVYPREPHGIRERAHQLDLLRRVRAWYDRWLRA
ncbi:alpha/beta hydrolase family protein [Ktedonobacter racemifer]|uniref:Peptidase S9 prolyl oligopeptidase active site domain protein n=1 Tax=Ktedonobacter racemifer DSM 44963 TaxID=485913 RepID=D6THZ8_KTERA|nr:S9 family peptidase [Ktedonobacter racemifer]EFH90968.1 peptidase S9 prolyl oligopeptidase active site domain protein [Ktedonobacter racemifer DSM 44963]